MRLLDVHWKVANIFEVVHVEEDLTSGNQLWPSVQRGRVGVREAGCMCICAAWGLSVTLTPGSRNRSSRLRVAIWLDELDNAYVARQLQDPGAVWRGAGTAYM